MVERVLVEARLLRELRDELEAIRRMAALALEKLDRLERRPVSIHARTETGHVGPSSIVERVRDALPEDVLPKLTVVDQGTGVVTITAEWLGKENWYQVDRKVKAMGGRWIRAGKDSRWEVPVP